VEAVRETWLAWRAAPWRGELLARAIAAVKAATPSGAGWEDLVGRLAATQALDHLQAVARARVRPELLLLMERLGRTPADAALATFELASVGGGVALERLWTRLSAEGLRTALARMTWGRYASCRERVVAAMLRRALAEGVGAAALAELRAQEEPLRSSLAAAILPALADDDPLRGMIAAQVERSDPFARVGLLLDMPAEERRRWLRLLRAPAAEGGDAAAAEMLRALVEPAAAAEWARVAALADRAARLDEWELRMAQLGPIATLAESRRWLAEVHAALAAGLDEVYRLQVGVPATLWGEALVGLSPAQACEALVWLTWGDPSADPERALAAVLACETLPGKARVRLLGMLLESCAELTGEPSIAAPRGHVRALAVRAAEEVLKTPEATPREAMLAALELPPAALAAAADRWCRADPLLQGRPEHGTWLLAEALTRLASAAGSAGRAEIVAIVRTVVAQETEAVQVARLAGCAAWMTGAEREALIRRACAIGEPRVVGSLIRQVPAEEVATALAGPIARALALPDAHDRWAALAGLVGELPDPQGAEVLRSLWRAQTGEREDGAVLAFPRWAMDDALRRELVAHELAHPYRPYTAWLLGSYARGLPAAELAGVLDRALAEFAAIVDAPTSPGNDAGPFVEMADLLTEAQVREALEIVERMAAIPGPGWGGDRERARQHLALRLAALGRSEEAEARIRATREPEGELGALAAIRMSQGTGWSEVARLVIADDAEALASAIGGLTWRLPAAARAGAGEAVEGLLAAVRRLADPERRGELVAQLWEGFGGSSALPAERWAAEIRAHTTGTRRTQLLLALAATTAGTEYVAEALASAEEAELEEWFAAYCAVAPRLPAATRVVWLERWLLRGSGPRPGLLRELGEGAVGGEVVGVLAVLGGDAALVAAARALVKVAELLD
jgi:hypothetical protein